MRDRMIASFDAPFDRSPSACTEQRKVHAMLAPLTVAQIYLQHSRLTQVCLHNSKSDLHCGTGTIRKMRLRKRVIAAVVAAALITRRPWVRGHDEGRCDP